MVCFIYITPISIKFMRILFISNLSSLSLRREFSYKVENDISRDYLREYLANAIRTRLSSIGIFLYIYVKWSEYMAS